MFEMAGSSVSFTDPQE